MAAARTNNTVVLAADSKVSNGGEEKKYVLIGGTGACLIEGFEGQAAHQIDISVRLRQWETRHPHADVTNQLPAMLDVAAQAWDDAGYSLGNLPGSRRVGSHISSLTCGDVVAGTAVIARGRTLVGADGSATIQIDPPVGDDLFYINGVFSDEEIFRWLANPEVFVNNSPRDDQDRLDQAFVKELVERKDALHVLDSWAIHSMSAAREGMPNGWSTIAISNAYRGLFLAAEDIYSAHVGPPNTAIVITPCGRHTTEVEADWTPVLACTRDLQQSTNSPKHHGR